MVLLVNIALSSALAFLLLHFWRESRAIARFSRAAVGETRRPMDALLQLASVIYRDVPLRHDDPSFINLPLLSALGATPEAVLRRGGCCSGKSRLMMLGARTLGLPAAQITLYHASGAAQHCLVEAVLDGRRMIVDPMYGIYYVDNDNRPLSLRQLRSGIRPRFRSLPYSTASSYPPNSYYDFDFARTRTANWTSSSARRVGYRVLSRLTRGAIDQTPQPSVLEWPQLVLAALTAALLVAFNLVAQA